MPSPYTVGYIIAPESRLWPLVSLAARLCKAVYDPEADTEISVHPAQRCQIRLQHFQPDHRQEEPCAQVWLLLQVQAASEAERELEPSRREIGSTAWWDQARLEMPASRI